MEMPSSVVRAIVLSLELAQANDTAFRRIAKTIAVATTLRQRRRTRPRRANAGHRRIATAGKLDCRIVVELPEPSRIIALDRAKYHPGPEASLRLSLIDSHQQGNGRDDIRTIIRIFSALRISCDIE